VRCTPVRSRDTPLSITRTYRHTSCLHTDLTSIDENGRLRAGSVDQVGFTIEQFVTILVYLQFNSVNPNAAADNSPKVRLALCCVASVCRVADCILGVV
jgi:hypothetical protein